MVTFIISSAHPQGGAAGAAGAAGGVDAPGPIQDPGHDAGAHGAARGRGGRGRGAAGRGRGQGARGGRGRGGHGGGEGARGGRQIGAGAWNEASMDVCVVPLLISLKQELLSILERTLPVSGAVWEAIEQQFNAWAEQAGQSTRKAAALKKRYRLLVRGEATGQGGPSPRQIRAREIERLTNESVGGALYEGDEQVSDEELDEDVLADEAAGIVSERTCIHACVCVC